MKIVKYKNPLLYIIDSFCTIAMYPWLALLSLFLSCYWSTTYERERPGQKIIQWAIFGPILGLFVAFLFPSFCHEEDSPPAIIYVKKLKTGKIRHGGCV